MTEQPDTAAYRAALAEDFMTVWDIEQILDALDAARAERDHEARVSANRLAAHDETYARLEAAVARAEASEACAQEGWAQANREHTDLAAANARATAEHAAWQTMNDRRALAEARTREVEQSEAAGDVLIEKLQARIATALAIYDRRDLDAAAAAGLVRRALTGGDE